MQTPEERLVEAESEVFRSRKQIADLKQENARMREALTAIAAGYPTALTWLVYHGEISAMSPHSSAAFMRLAEAALRGEKP